jgi:hypothetical protein
VLGAPKPPATAQGAPAHTVILNRRAFHSHHWGHASRNMPDPVTHGKRGRERRAAGLAAGQALDARSIPPQVRHPGPRELVRLVSPSGRSTLLIGSAPLGSGYGTAIVAQTFAKAAQLPVFCNWLRPAPALRRARASGG